VHKLSDWVTVYWVHGWMKVWWRHWVDSRPLYWSQTPAAYRSFSLIIQSDVKWKQTGQTCNVNRPILCILCQIRWQFIGCTNTLRSDDLIGSIVGLFTDLTHRGHIGRLAILAISGQSHVTCKLVRCICNVKRPKLCIYFQIRWHSIGSRKI
jgi:hypothetical protein